MNLAVIGVNFKTAPVALRELVSVTGKRIPEAIKSI